MLDLLFLAVIAGFFLLALAYIAGCDTLRKGAKKRMSWESILAAVISVLLMIYLVYALLRPEKF